MAQDSFHRVNNALNTLSRSLAGYSIDRETGQVSQIGGAGSTDDDESRHSDEGSEGSAYEDPPALFTRGWDLTTKRWYPEISNVDLRSALNRLKELETFFSSEPYSIDLYIKIAGAYVELGYPDLAAGAAYKALTLVDEVLDDSGEYHEEAFESLKLSIAYEPLMRRMSVLHPYPEMFSRFVPYDKEERHLREDVGIDIHPQDDEVLVWARDIYSQAAYGPCLLSLFVSSPPEQDESPSSYDRETSLALTGSLFSVSKHVTQSLKGDIGFLRSAYEFVQRGLHAHPEDDDLLATRDAINKKVATHFKSLGRPYKPNTIHVEEFPEVTIVRRELYPWNKHEPNRISELDFLNKEMSKVAPKLEVRATDLPVLSVGTKSKAPSETTKQLGVFAKEDIAPGEIILTETSLLTANNRLHDSLCDACGADLPDLTVSNPTPDQVAAAAKVVTCPECNISVFCTPKCLDLAQKSYHPALCDKDAEAIAKDVPPAEAADALYAHLLLRTLAMAETQAAHPLDLSEVKFIWGDYHNLPVEEYWDPHHEYVTTDRFPKTLPFSFSANILMPLHMMEKMGVNVFESLQYDFWVLNTLYAKFRGTASARLSGLGGRPLRGPEVSAVHPMWCLANHSCDPNVSWEWGGSINFWARKERVQWKAGKGKTKQARTTAAGIKKGEEVLNHYCDIDLPLKERREWASGSLGGLCMCERCVWEEAQEKESARQRSASRRRKKK
ncbi:hypothetical protein LTR04_007198 [Oleoguttula sp. CCFEE 6159]|nr:hypothetical protein LTR04_007198 [Oleoguttula sp. CCFEE 6159]